MDNKGKKKEFNFKEKYSTNTKYKEQSFYFCGDAFVNACGTNLYSMFEPFCKTSTKTIHVDKQKLYI